MPEPWFLAGSVLGGFVAGCIALVVGGLGVFRLYQVMHQSLSVLTEAVTGVQRRVEREIKTRAGELGGRPTEFEKLAQEVLARAGSPAVTAHRGDDRRMSRAEILRLADRE